MDLVISKNEKEKVLSQLEENAKKEPVAAVKYLDLGVSVIRVIFYSKEAISIIEKQLDYVLRDGMEHFDSTIVLWKCTDYKALAESIISEIPKKNKMQAMAEMLWLRKNGFNFELLEKNDEKLSVFGRFDGLEQYVEVFDDENKTAYFGHSCYEPEVFVKQGHALVRVINHLVKSQDTNLTHGAVFGYDGKGFLLCGRGKRGKSTLTVESMLQGFDYVSDDYQILKCTDSGLLAYPIYSIVTLSYRMYNEMFDRFRGKFVCNNFSHEKYLFSISEYYPQFRTGYPVKLCLFPEIVADEYPRIVHCSVEEKGRAIVQLIHSTLMQVNELGDKDTVKRQFLMIKNLPFYKFNLSGNISRNTEFLREYLASLNDFNGKATELSQKQTDNTAEHPSIDTAELPLKLIDITYGLAVILDTEKYSIVAFNKFATNVFLLLCSGVKQDEIRDCLRPFENNNKNILNEYDKMLELMTDRGFFGIDIGQYLPAKFNQEYAQKSDYRLSIVEYLGKDTVELL